MDEIQSNKEAPSSKEMNTLKVDDKRSNIKAEIWDWVKHLGIAVVIAFIITKFVIVNAHIPTPSMETTIMVNDRIIASRLHYAFSTPKRGDIVVFKFPDDESMLFVKRVIGLPGETVVIKDGSVYINNEKLDEPYLNTVTKGNTGPFVVPEGKYFMLGDNRNSSKDSRFWNEKYVSKDKILGKAIFKYYPGFKALK